MAALSDVEVAQARSMLGDYRFESRLEAIKRYCGAGFPASTFRDVLQKLQLGELNLHMKVDGDYEVRRGRRVR